MTAPSRRAAAAVLVAALIITAEIYLIFIHREDAFRIIGARAYRVAEFSQQQPISQAFLMLGNGLNAIDVRLVSDAAAVVTFRWTLSRGSRDAPPVAAVAVGEQSVRLGIDSPQWVRLPVTRDGSSHNRWYTIELQLVDAQGGSAAAPPHIAVMATSDNPDRGGVLWVGDKRQPGSMMMRANWESATVYRRFVTEGVPHLPRLLREPIAQALVVVVIHWAFAVYALSLLKAAVP